MPRMSRMVPDGPASGTRRPGERVFLAAVLVTVAAVYAPMLATGTRLADNDDFLMHCARRQALRTALFHYRSFPLRSHFLGGGYPTLADPEDPTLNPLTWMLLPLPAPAAVKARFFLAAVLAALGTVLLARGPLGYSRRGAAFSALAFSLAGWLPWQVRSGNANEVYVALLPLCLFLLLTLRRGRPGRLVLLAALFYTMLTDGKLTTLAGFLFLGVVCLAWALAGPRREEGAASRLAPLGWFLAAAGLASLVGMLRILPTLELFLQGGPGWDLSTGTREVRGTFRGITVYPTFPELAGEMVGVRPLTAAAVPIHVGLPAAALLVVGLFHRPRRVGLWAAVGVLFFWLILGPNAPVDLLAVLTRVPLMVTLRAPAKYFAPLVALCVGLGAGAGFDPLLAHRLRRAGALLSGILLAALLLLTVPEAVRLTRGPFTLPPAGRPRSLPADFYSVAGRRLPRNRTGPVLANTYFNLLRGVGTIDFHAGVPLPSFSRPRYLVESDGRLALEPDYRGEAYSTSTGRPLPARFGPNHIVIDIHASPDAPPIVVVNQNYDGRWHSGEGKVIPWGGLLAVRLRDGDRPRRVVLQYRSRAFRAGLAASAAGVLVTVLVGVLLPRWKGGSAKAPVPAEGGSPGPADPRPRVRRLPLSRAGAVSTGTLLLAAALLPFSGWGFTRWDPSLVARRGLSVGRRLDPGVPAYRRRRWAAPGGAAEHYDLALAFEARGDRARALEHYRALLRLRPNDGAARLIVGRALFRAGRTGEALEQFRRAAALRPKDAGARLTLSRCLSRAGRPAEALEAAREALHLAPGEPAVLARLARLLAECGEYKAALDLLEKALALRPNHPLLSVRLAALLAAAPEAQLRDAPRAEGLARQALRRLEGVEKEDARKATLKVDALEALSAALGEQGARAAALAALREALDLARVVAPDRAAALQPRISPRGRSRPAK